jgi:internalin A
MTQKNNSIKKKWLLKIIGVCLLSAAAFGLFTFIYNYNYYQTQSYKKSVNEINAIIAKQLDKDPNYLTTEDFEKIEEIDISGNMIRNLKPIVKLKNLKTINFQISKAEYADLSPLARIHELKTLEFVFHGIIQRKLSRYENFRYNILSTDNTGAYSLVLSISIPFDFSQLENIKNLESLKVSTPYTSNIESLAGLTNLKYIEINTYNWRINDLQPFSGLVSLEYLGLRGQGLIIRDCTSISNLKNLGRLSITSAHLYNLDGLESLENLQELDLSDTKITDINAIKKLTGLKKLNLKNVSLTDEQIAEFQKALPDLEIVR